MTLLFKHKRVISFLLLVLFCILTMFTIPVLEADAFAIPVLPDIAIAILGALLTAGGITFVSTQDMTVGVNGFNNAMSQNTAYNSFVTNLIAAPVVDGVVQLTSDLSEGWSYFWEHASDYFGVETGVKPDVPMQGDISEFVTGSLPVVPLASGYNASYIIDNGVSNINIISKTLNYSGNVELPNGAQNLSFTLTPANLKYVQNIQTFSYSGYSFNIGVVFAGGTYLRVFSLDNFTTCYVISYFDYRCYECFSPVIENGFLKIYSYLGFPGSPSDYRPRQLVFDSSLPFTPALDLPWGDGSICPDYDTDSEDTLYTGQDVFGAFEDVLRKLGVGLGIGLNIGDVLADLEKGIGKDITITPTQTDVIPDEIAKELDKPMPSPTPQPSASPSPSPSPPPDIPPDMLMPDVTRKFPFCLPFDLIHLVEVFNAEPEAPRFEIPIEFAFINYNDKFVLDFTEFEPVSKICRIFVTLEFIVFLILITRKITGG